MAALDDALARDPDDRESLVESLRLNVITGQRPNRVQPLLSRAKVRAPDVPDVYRYAAIYHVNSFFQYETALKEIERYRELRPDDPFGYRMEGFLYYRLGRYQDAIDVIGKAAGLDRSDGYAYALMARNYTLLARKARASEKERLEGKARDMWRRAAAASPGSARLDRLNRWLEPRLRG